jgi:predicted RNA polymerase sigma factor
MAYMQHKPQPYTLQAYVHAITANNAFQEKPFWSNEQRLHELETLTAQEAQVDHKPQNRNAEALKRSTSQRLDEHDCMT